MFELVDVAFGYEYDFTHPAGLAVACRCARNGRVIYCAHHHVRGPAAVVRMRERNRIRTMIVTEERGREIDACGSLRNPAADTETEGTGD